MRFWCACHVNFNFIFFSWVNIIKDMLMFWSSECKFSSGQPNFGAIEIDWAAAPVTVRIEIRDTSGHPVAGVNISLSELQWRNINSSTSLKKSGEIRRHCSLEVSLPWIVRYRLAIFFYSALAGMPFFYSLVQKFLRHEEMHTRMSMDFIMALLISSLQSLSNVLFSLFFILVQSGSTGCCLDRPDFCSDSSLQEMSPQVQAWLTAMVTSFTPLIR